MVLLHPYVPGHRPADQCPTWEALADLLDMEGGQQWHVPCRNPQDYAMALRVAGGSGADVLVVEHDIVPTRELVTELVACEHPFCATDYVVEAGRLWSSLPEGLGLGLALVRTAAWEAITQWPRVPQVAWTDVAGVMRDRLPPVHVHPGPAQHSHHY